MKQFLSLVIIPFFLVNAYAQDIITLPSVVSGIETIGESARVNFNVNIRTVCDTYTVSSSVDYNTKSVKIIVDYTYNSLCASTFAFFTESHETDLLLLEGIYSVSLELNVPADILLNETISVGTVSVIGPPGGSCDNGPIFPTIEPCPLVDANVCACNGQTYQNECFAYFEDENGFYNNFNCEDYVVANARLFACDFYFANRQNTFEKYSCDEDLYKGKESYLYFENDIPNDSLIVDYVTSNEDVRLFLVRLVSGNLECLAKSENKTLSAYNLEVGDYYVIADSRSTLDYNFELCRIVSAENLSKEQSLTIYPNPSLGTLNITMPNTEILAINILDINGRSAWQQEVSDREVYIKHNLTQGFYAVKVKTKWGVIVKPLTVL